MLVGNERLQEMMGIMARERGAKLYATDERYRIILKYILNLIFGL